MGRLLRLLCPAKINLHLRVGPARSDGFHPLLSWMCTVGLFDTLTLESPDRSTGAEAGTGPVAQDSSRPLPGNASGKPGSAGAAGGADGSAVTTAAATGAAAAGPVSLLCDAPDLPCDERNLVVRIAKAWWHQTSADGARAGAGALHARSVSASLQKRIPMGAGLGGGSSDGAVALMGLNALWNTGRGANELSAFAARFGSDLSFFFHGPSSICTGRGEVVRPIPRPTPRRALLVLPSIVMPTPDVYRKFDAMGLGRSRDLTEEPDWQAWSRLSARDLLPLLVNDLEAPACALRPELDELRRSLEQRLGRSVRMSGSGSSLFTLFDEQSEAEAAKADLMSHAPVRIELAELAPRIADDLAAG